MSFDLVDLDETSEDAGVLPSVNQHDLVDLHKQLLSAAPGRGDHYQEATHVPIQLPEQMSIDRQQSDPQIVTQAVSSIVEALRRGPLHEIDRFERFSEARGWINHLRLQRRARQEAA